ncbi:hypothetical protein M378DRAFT_17998 [Amanita muscaria Koide BX008]|uniref:Uncharacterized protein n=1 Tax=Amanita muscaria (strain Koide BX008) TaxID=946122 RepID=A0A0C2RYF3_AMAMK|nr:hypothetical protein M378DRAFT_17998 [Amanita muscaria Koide BX008]
MRAPPAPQTQFTRDVSEWQTTLSRRAALNRPCHPSQIPDEPQSDWIGPPSTFRLKDWKGARLNPNGHVSVRETNNWSQDPSKLWKSTVRFWDSGKPYQRAKEASCIPYDQQSLAQRWAIRMATKDRVLPEGRQTREPDIEDETVLARAPNNIRVDSQGRLNVQDITVWLFLLMTQPKAREGTVNWFWYLACMMFSRRGQYTQVLKDLQMDPQGNEGFSYSPKCFVHAGHWSTNDLACHFYRCGLRPKDPNTLFHDFGSSWIGKLDLPINEPDWSKVPTPREVEVRPNANQRKKWKVKKQRDRLAQGFVAGEWGVPNSTAIRYNEPPPLSEAPPAPTASPAPLVVATWYHMLWAVAHSLTDKLPS